jgi:plasmid stabilization system protein ParE
MIRFAFSPHAEHDIDEIADYLQGLPKTPALRIGAELQEAIRTITNHPAIGHLYGPLTRHSSHKILRFICGQYLIFYYVEAGQIRFVGFIHGKRNVDSIMSGRSE